MKPNPRRTRRTVIRKTKDEPLLPVDSETPPSPEAIRFTFHIDNKTTRDNKETKKRSAKKSKGPRKTR